MPKKHSPGCNCCGCASKNLFEDDFSSPKDGWLSTGGPWFLADDLLNTNSSGTYYRSVTTTDTENLRIIVSASCLDLVPPAHATEKGIFIGGVATLRHHNIGGGLFKLYLDFGVDALGMNPTETVDLGFIGGNNSVSLRMDKDWNSGTDHFFLLATGGTGFAGQAQYSREIDISLGPTFTCGVLGDGRYDSFSLVRNHLANAAHCPQCLQCKGDELPKEIYLSVPPMTNGTCLVCETLSGDHVLKYKTVGQLVTCQYVAGCMWATDATGVCSEDDVCPPGFLWRISGSGVLDATTSVNVLKYNLEGAFDCAPGAINSWSYGCTVCDGTCIGFPATLTTVNQS